ncbi:MAG TPA: PAS domain-containing protein, partial [Phenylobacterium sp.]|nr:PAS domain-containing protein [Phenylobacterium sp.]
MATNLTSDPAPPKLSSSWLEHAPAPMATVEGATHRVTDINAAFCRLIGKARDEVVGRTFGELLPDNDEGLALLDHVYHTGDPVSHMEQQRSDPAPTFWSYMLWPMMADGRPMGVVIQVTETAPPQERTLAMNEALLLGSLRQHELTAAADLSNVRLQTEIGQ